MARKHKVKHHHYRPVRPGKDSPGALAAYMDAQGKPAPTKFNSAQQIGASSAPRKKKLAGHKAPIRMGRSFGGR